MKDEFVDILMSTYNGEKYLNEQINSIINQTHTNWKLIIRDDGSTDNTTNIIEEYCKALPNKIFYINDEKGNVGYRNSFYLLLFQSTANYIMFADQDDYWHHDKLKTMLDFAGRQTDQITRKPLLICSDLSICDENLNIIEESYFKHINHQPKLGAQSTLLASHLHGCTFLFNRALLNECISLSNNKDLLNDYEIKGHDNFMSTICAIVGNILYLNIPLIKHRVHDSSIEGFSKSNKQSLIIQLKTVIKYGLNNKAYRDKLFNRKIKESVQIISRLQKTTKHFISKEYTNLLNIDETAYLERKYMNIISPYVNHLNIIDKIVYIICF
jgi:glycosyltransferase involved in cell wall biosynthesis